MNWSDVATADEIRRPGRDIRVRGRLAYSLASRPTPRPTEADVASHAARVAADLARLGSLADAPADDAPETPGGRREGRYGPGRRKHDYALILAIRDEDPARGLRTIAALYKLRSGLEVDPTIVRRVVRRDRGEGPRPGPARATTPRRCPGCGEGDPVRFYRNRSRPSGLDARCKACQARSRNPRGGRVA